MAEYGLNISEVKRKWANDRLINTSCWNGNVDWPSKLKEGNGKNSSPKERRRTTMGYREECENKEEEGISRGISRAVNRREVAIWPTRNMEKLRRRTDKAETSKVQQIKNMIEVLMSKLNSLVESREKVEIIESLAKSCRRFEYQEERYEKKDQIDNEESIQEPVVLGEETIGYMEEVQMSYMEEDKALESRRNEEVNGSNNENSGMEL